MGKNKTVDETLIAAVEKGSLAKVKQALAEGANANCKKGKKHLLGLVPHREDSIKGELIMAGAWQSELKGALVWAVDCYPAAVPLLIERGADINLGTFMGTPILVAAGKGDIESARLLLEAGADPGAGGGFSTALTEAIGAGNRDLVELLLSKGAHPDATGEHVDTTPLALASAMGQKTVVEDLLARGAEVDRICQRVSANIRSECLGENGVTALMMAARHDHGEVVSLLLQAGASPHKKDGQGRTALDLAGPEAASVFSERGIEAVPVSPEEALLTAAEKGNLEAVQAALQAGADPNTTDERQRHSGWTALIWAAARGHRQVASVLLAAGADPAIPENGDRQALKWLVSETDVETLRGQLNMTLARTALHIALEFAHPEVALLLLQQGSPVDEKDGLGYAPLHLAAEQGYFEVVKALLAAGADSKIKGPDKTQALDLASQNGHKEISDLLLSRERLTGKKLNKALLTACQAGQAELVRQFLWLGAEANAKSREFGPALVAALGACRWVDLKADDDGAGSISISFTDKGRRALMPVPESDALTMVRDLLQAGADPESAGETESALMIAVRQRYPEVVKLLLEAGADPHRQVHEFSPVSLAKLYKLEQIVEILQQTKVLKREVKTAKPKPAAPSRPTFKSAPRPRLLRAGRGKNFQAALAEIAELCGSDPVSLEDGAYTLHIKSSAPEITLQELQDRYLERGCFLAYQSSPSKLWALPLKDPLKALAYVQTAGPNYDVGTGNLIEWFSGIERPYRITALDHDLVAGRFLGKVRDPANLAKSMYELCPDTVEQGFQSLKALTESLREKNPAFTLWWD